MRAAAPLRPSALFAKCGSSQEQLSAEYAARAKRLQEIRPSADWLLRPASVLSARAPSCRLAPPLPGFVPRFPPAILRWHEPVRPSVRAHASPVRHAPCATMPRLV